MLTGFGRGSVTMARASSNNSPVNSPALLRLICPPAGTGVSLVTFHFFNAVVLRMYSWPPRTSTTGLFGAACSISSAFRRRRGRRIGDRRQQLAKRADVAEIDTGTAAFVVEMVVGDARRHEAALQIDHSGLRADITAHITVGPG